MAPALFCVGGEKYDCLSSSWGRREIKKTMKYSFFMLFFLLIIVSCKRTNDSICKNANYCSVKDNEDSLYLNIPEGYTTGDITLYVPQNEEEKNFDLYG